MSPAVASGVEAYKVPVRNGHTFGPIKRDGEAHLEKRMPGMPCPGAKRKSQERASDSWFAPLARLLNWKEPPRHSHHGHHFVTVTEDKPDFGQIVTTEVWTTVEGSEEKLNYLPVFGDEVAKEEPKADGTNDKAHDWSQGQFEEVKWFAPGEHKGWRPQNDRLPTPGWLPVKMPSIPWANKWSADKHHKEHHHHVDHEHHGHHGHAHDGVSAHSQGDEDHDHEHKHKHHGDKHHKHHGDKHHKHHGDKHHKHHDHKHHDFKGYKSTKCSLKHFVHKVSHALNELSPGARWIITGFTLLSSFLVGFGLGQLIRRVFLRDSREKRRARRRERKDARKAAKAAYKASKAAKASKAVEAGYTDEAALPSYGEAETDALVERQ